VLSSLFKTSVKRDDQDYFDDAYADDNDDVKVDDGEADDDDDSDNAPTAKAKKNKLATECSDLPYSTDTYTDDNGNKHFIAILFVAPNCLPSDTNIVVNDRTVSVQVASVQWNVDTAQKLAAGVKNDVKLSDKSTQLLTTRLLNMPKLKPWRYELTSPFQLDPKGFHWYRTTVPVGDTEAYKRHDILFVDACEYTMIQSNEPTMI